MKRPAKRTGRRPGPNTTRSLIEETARKQFAQLGYDRTSMRQIALEAEVDPTLVSHYFGTKLDLFIAVVELPIDPGALIDHVTSGERDSAGVRLATVVLDVLDDEVRRRPIVGMIRAATSEPEAARLVREFLTRNIVIPIAEHLDTDHADYRAGLVMSQIVGLTLARYIIGVEPLASHPRELVAADLGATLQRYLLGDLSHTPPIDQKGADHELAPHRVRHVLPARPAIVGHPAS
ncbi:TetR family transcriptional regulator [Rhodococcus sp. WMMA185]|uniref:TetR/AcrR family transcriptional regulator n=1 Tax=Rhodococcus sp. WMMA185 TaxID=679318 RepID=UPI000878E83F|nr:TetR family transcriptional regulator [Rhodococcus sp. WMMA185]AOW93733.1 TetR family transcriptional regulator [Rhodococcus sp. WMMA185]